MMVHVLCLSYLCDTPFDKLTSENLPEVVSSNHLVCTVEFFTGVTMIILTSRVSIT